MAQTWEQPGSTNEPVAVVIDDDISQVSSEDVAKPNVTVLTEYDPVELDANLDARYIPKKSVWSWALWDWSTQPFSSIIITFVFIPLYLTNNAFLDPRYLALPVNDPIRIHALDDLAASIGAWVTIAGIITALLIPILSRRVQQPGRIKKKLAIANILLILVMLALFLLRPEYQFFTLGAALIAFGLVLDTIANVYYNSLLPSVSSSSNRGLISRMGWGAGYLAGVLALFVVLMLELTDWFGHLDSLGLNRFRFIALACAIWALLFGWALYLFVPEPTADFGSADAGVGETRDGLGFSGRRARIVSSYTSIFDTMRDLFNNSPKTFWFLVAAAIYRDGLAGILTFGAIIAAITFGFTPQMVLLFGVLAYLVIGFATQLVGRLNDLWGARRVIIISLAVLLAAGLLALILHNLGPVVFWIFGLVLCAVLGPVQAASRSYLEQVTPPAQATEVFSFYAITSKAASFLSAGMWTVFIAAFGATIWGLLGILLVIAVGLGALMFLVPDAGHSAEGDSNAFLMQYGEVRDD